MKPVWLVEADVYGAEADPLVAEVRRHGMAAEVVPHRALRDPALAACGRVLADGDRVIGYGTFPFARQIQLHRRWVPGAWCDPTNLDCTTYFAYFGKYLLNQNYAVMPGVEAIRLREWLLEVFGRDGEVFARPTCCQKVFTGRCMDAETFAAGLSPTRYDPATLVVVAAPRVIGREWRLVVAGDRVVAGSQYAVDGQKAIAPDLPAEVTGFVEGMLADVRWRPDPIFMADVCEADGRLWLVELNGFSCSWLYACDLPRVVAAAGELAAATR